MRRRFVAVSLFLLALVAGDHVLAYLGKRAIRNSSMPLAELYSGHGAADLLILGNSRAMRHFDPAALQGDLGMTVKNYGLLGSSTDFSAVLLEDYLHRYPAPKAVLVEVSGLSADNSAVVSQRLYRRDSVRIGHLLKKVSREFYYSGLAFHLLDLNSDVYFNTLHKVLAPYPNVLLNGTMRANLAEDERAVSRPYFSIRPANEAALAQIRRLSEEYRFVLIPVLTPVAPQLARALAGEITALIERTETIVGTRIINLTKLELAGRDFYDPVHLNAEGVFAIHQELLRSLASYNLTR